VGNTADTMCLDNGLFSFLIRIWPEVDMYMNRGGLERYRPGLALVTERRGRLAGGVEGFTTDAMVPVRVYDYWPDEYDRPRLRTTLYAPADLASRVPAATASVVHPPPR